MIRRGEGASPARAVPESLTGPLCRFDMAIAAKAVYLRTVPTYGFLSFVQQGDHHADV